MADAEIPDDLRDFITKYIDSIAQLEALMLLRRNPQTRWNAVAVARQLYIQKEETAAILARLVEDGFAVAEDGAFRYATAAPELVALAGRLAELYNRQLIPVTNLIHAKPRRIREFADAFKLRKDK